MIRRPGAISSPRAGRHPYNPSLAGDFFSPCREKKRLPAMMNLKRGERGRDFLLRDTLIIMNAGRPMNHQERRHLKIFKLCKLTR
ncbi:hypothetical protein BHM03_00045225 [Ensete ventricosum]|nr:hypothetical protein BHM03_00045225 [Ensete ventricosum]